MWLCCNRGIKINLIKHDPIKHSHLTHSEAILGNLWGYFPIKFITFSFSQNYTTVILQWIPSNHFTICVHVCVKVTWAPSTLLWLRVSEKRRLTKPVGAVLTPTNSKWSHSEKNVPGFQTSESGGGRFELSLGTWQQTTQRKLYVSSYFHGNSMSGASIMNNSHPRLNMY